MHGLDLLHGQLLKIDVHFAFGSQRMVLLVNLAYTFSSLFSFAVFKVRFPWDFSAYFAALGFVIGRPAAQFIVNTIIVIVVVIVDVDVVAVTAVTVDQGYSHSISHSATYPQPNPSLQQRLQLHNPFSKPIINILVVIEMALNMRLLLSPELQLLLHNLHIFAFGLLQ